LEVIFLSADFAAQAKHRTTEHTSGIYPSFRLNRVIIIAVFAKAVPVAEPSEKNGIQFGAMMPPSFIKGRTARLALESKK